MLCVCAHVCVRGGGSSNLLEAYGANGPNLRFCLDEQETAHRW